MMGELQSLEQRLALCDEILGHWEIVNISEQCSRSRANVLVHNQ
jgi:hypothetical protein